MAYYRPEELEHGLPEGGGEVVLLRAVVDLVAGPQQVDLCAQRNFEFKQSAKVKVMCGIPPCAALCIQ